ncbi:MAG: hypothetical protein ACREJ9_05235 [Candidatus Rokuibacteriota bacterium]
MLRVAPARRWVVLALACALGAAGSAAWAQPLPLRRPPDPQGLEGPRRAPLTLTPTLTVEWEFNDNVVLNNDDKREDFITRFTPGISLEWESPIYRLAAAYSFSAELHAKETHLSRAFDAHRFALDTLYRVDPQLTLTLTDTFAFDTDTNLIAPEGVATGRDQAYGNTLAAGATWTMTPLTKLHGTASWSIQRFDREDLFDSDVYRAELILERTLTTRLTGSVGYEFGYFDIQREENVTTHTPRIGVTYRFTETLTGTLRAGPAIQIEEDNDTRVTPAVTANLRQRRAWGAIGVDYNRSIGVAGGLGGPTDNQSVGVLVQLTTLTKGLTVELAPRYFTTETPDDRIDVRSFTLPLTAIYRVNAWLAVVGAYNFLHQRSDSRVTVVGAALANDVDQNRISVGVQVGYPIRFD